MRLLSRALPCWIIADEHNERAAIRKAAANGARKPAAPTKAPRLKGKTAAKGKGKGKAVFSDDEDEDVEQAEDQLAADEEEQDVPEPSTSARPTQSQSQSLYGSQARPQRLPPSPSQELFGPGGGGSAGSAKRRRVSPPAAADDEEEEPEEEAGDGSPAPRATASQASSQGRKRARDEGADEDEGALGGTGELGLTQTQLDADEDSGVLAAGPAGSDTFEREESVESMASLAEVQGKRRRL